MKKEIAGVKRNVFFMGLTSLLADIAGEMIFPIFPLFLTNVLNASKSIVGLIEGLTEFIISVSHVLSGWLSDLINKRKIFIFFGYLFAAISKPLLVLANTWQHALAIRILDRFGKGIREPPRDALIAVASKEHGKSFGFHRMMDTLGAVIGTITVFVLLSIFIDNYRLVFLISTIPAVLAVLTVSFFVKEQKIKREKIKIKINSFNTKFKKLLLVITVFGLGNFSYAFLILKAKDIGIATVLIPILYLLYNLIYASLAFSIGKLSDKVGKKEILLAGYFIFALLSLGFAFNFSINMLWVLFAFYGLFKASTFAIEKAFIADLVSEEKEGTALGIYSMLVGLTALPASYIFGKLWDLYGSNVAFIYSATVSGIALLLLLFLVKRDKKS